jgi:nucleoside-diphosphate-sugar epimerase
VDALIAAGNSERGAGLAIHVADDDYLNSGEFFGRLSQALKWPAPRRGVYALAYGAAWLRRARGLAGPWPEQVARRGRACLLDCLQAVNVLDFMAKKSVEQGLSELAGWAAALSGPSEIERLARPLPDRAEIARHARVADQLSA